MVDLPAPFWPISAWTSPAATSSVAALRAGMPPNALLIARIDRRGDAVDFVAAIYRSTPAQARGRAQIADRSQATIAMSLQPRTGMTRKSSKRPGSSLRRSGPLFLASDSIAHQYEPAMLAAALLLS